MQLLAVVLSPWEVRIVHHGIHNREHCEQGVNADVPSCSEVIELDGVTNLVSDGTVSLLADNARHDLPRFFSDTFLLVGHGYRSYDTSRGLLLLLEANGHTFNPSFPDSDSVLTKDGAQRSSLLRLGLR